MSHNNDGLLGLRTLNQISILSNFSLVAIEFKTKKRKRTKMSSVKEEKMGVELL